MVNARYNKQSSPEITIINFTTIDLDDTSALQIGTQPPAEVVDLLRTYVNRPHLYLVEAGREQQVGAILKQLKAIRSTCYPYALFVIGGEYDSFATPDLAVFPVSRETQEIEKAMRQFATETMFFDKSRLSFANPLPLPDSVDVLVIGGGITGLYAAQRLAAAKRSVCIVEAREILGGIWSSFANSKSQVNTSEGAYRLLEKTTRNNRDHSSTREILEDLETVAASLAPHLFTRTKALRFAKKDGGYRTTVRRGDKILEIDSKGIILAINDRVGIPRELVWPNQVSYRGVVAMGISDKAHDIDWRGKKVAIVGMGAFAIENTRTALEGGAAQVSVICRRHGTVCPKIIDYLNFATPYDDNFHHEKKSNIKNMMLWKKLYDLSGATQPECWMGKIKHEGHTISVSDIWFIGHHLKKLSTMRGEVRSLYEDGVILDSGERLAADVIVNCVGFERMSPVVRELCDYREMFNNNYVDKDLMYLADAYIDDDVFNSFFGSSVLEMTKFYLEVYLEFFDSPEYEKMNQLPGMARISVEDRRWSHYIAAAEALIEAYPKFRELAWQQVRKRTSNFLEAHDLPVYIAQNKREWYETHQRLSDRPLREDECLPYVFDKLLEVK